jgi:hypothetical protein
MSVTLKTFLNYFHFDSLNKQVMKVADKAEILAQLVLFNFAANTKSEENMNQK